jgi:hypothetical protein
MQDAELKLIKSLVDVNKDDKYDLDEIQQLFKRININMTRNEIKKVCQGKQILNTTEFEAIYEKIREQSQIQKLYKMLCGNENTISRKVWNQFLVEKQRDAIDQNELPALDYKDFLQYFMDDRNRLYSFHKQSQYMDMTQPWHKYFMNSRLENFT